MRAPSTIAGKLALSFAVLTSIALLALGAAHVGLQVTRSSVQEATGAAARLQAAATNMDTAASESRVAVAEYLRTGQAGQRDQLRRAQLDFKAAAARYVDLAGTARERRLGMDARSVFGLLQDAESALVRQRDLRRAAYGAVNGRYEELEDQLDEAILDAPALADRAHVRELALSVQADLYDILADLSAHSQHDDGAARDNVSENLEEIDEGLDALLAQPLPAASRAAVRVTRMEAARSDPSAREVIEVERTIAAEGRRESELARELKELLDEGILPLASRRLDEARSSAETATSSATLVSGVLVPLFLLTAVAATVLVTRSVTRPVRRLIAETEAVEREGLGHRIGGVGGSEFGLLAGHFDRMVERLEQTTVSRDRLEASQVELRRLAGELAHQAAHDPLTGLINRREFDRRLAAAMRRTRDEGASEVLCYVDLDQFKLVNDTCGHAAGDELLRRIATVLTAELRADDVLARLGGDEFGVLLTCFPEDGVGAGERLRAALGSTRFTWGDRAFSLTASVGVVPVDGTTPPEVLLASADAACYAAKEKGRDRVQLFAAEDSELAARRGEMLWAPAILRALDEGRLRLDHQPIVPLAPDAEPLPHYEVLVRLLDEQGEVVPPGAFIPAAERYGLMGRVDRWVLETAIAHLGVRHADAGDGAPVEFCAINLSATSVSDPRLAGEIEALLDAHRVPPRAICFEITETAAIAHLDTARDLIARLGARGCRFALDDFGRGSSSFGYLRDLPVDIVKIDGSFVRDMGTDPLCEAIVRAVHTVARSMGAQTVAEFVEDDDVLARVRAIGVDYAQGFGVGRPTPLVTPPQPAAAPARTPQVAATV